MYFFFNLSLKSNGLGSTSGVVKVSSLLGCYAVLVSKQTPQSTACQSKRLGIPADCSIYRNIDRISGFRSYCSI